MRRDFIYVFVFATAIVMLLSFQFYLRNQLSHEMDNKITSLEQDVQQLRKSVINLSDKTLEMFDTLSEHQKDKHSVQEKIDKQPKNIVTHPFIQEVHDSIGELNYPSLDDSIFEPLFDSYHTNHSGGWIIQGLENTGPKLIEHGILKVGGWDYWAVISKKEFRDFILRFDVKFDSRGNSGILIHTPSNSIYKDESRIEIQLESGDDKKIKTDVSRMGAIERIKAPLAYPAKPIGEWNKVEIAFITQKIWVIINGVIVQEAVNIMDYPHLHDHPLQGHIAIQRNDFKKAVYFKNIRIKRL